MKPSQWLLAYILLAMVQSLRLTYRIRVFGQEHRRQAESQHVHGSFCIALWHEHLFASIIAHAGQRFAPLASLSSDGDLVTFVMDRLGFHTIRGSSSRGGAAARRELVDMTNDGYFTAITVDGPRGPRRRVKGGVVDIARRTQVAILPLVVLSDRQWVLNSWDEFKIPKPFARLAVYYGEPFSVASDTSGLAFGEAKARLRQRLADAEHHATQALTQWRNS